MSLRMHAFHRRSLSALALPLLVTVLGFAPSARAATLTWVGVGSSWQTPQNWLNGVAPVSGDSLTFTGAPANLTAFNDADPLTLTIQNLSFGPGTGNFVISGSAFRLNGGITVNRVGTTTIQNNITLPDAITPQVSVDAGSNLVITGNITGRNNVLTKVGSGTLTLTGNNNYTRSSIFSAVGKTVIQEGTIVMGSQSAIGNIYSALASDEFVTIGAAGTLNLNGFQVNLANITPSSTGTVSNGFVFSNTSTRAIDFTLAGSASLRVDFGSTVIVNSSNSYTGATTLQNGQLILNNANALGSTSGIVFGSSGTLVYTASNTTDYSSKLQLGSSQSKFRVDTGGQTITFASNITGPDFIGISEEFIKYGAGTLVLTGNNSYLDIMRVDSGTVRFSNLNNLCKSSGSVILGNGSGLQWAAGSTTDISGRLNLDTGGGILDTNGNNVTFASGILGGGQLTKAGAGTLTLNAASTGIGSTTVNGGALKLNIGGATGALRGALAINTGATVESAVTNAFGFATGLKIDSVAINGGTLNHTATGDCGWGVAYTLSNGALMTSNGGVSNANAATQFAFGGGTGANTSVNATSGTSTIAGHVDLRGDNGNTNVNFTVATGATLNITAGISSHSDFSTVGPVGFTKLGGGTLVLTGSNTYSGTTAVNGGVIDFNNASAFGNGGAIAVNTGTLRWTGNSADLSSRLTLDAGGGTFDTNGNTVTFASAISGTGALVKSGSGFLRFTSSNSHSGDTTVNGGVIVLAGPTTARGQLGGLDGSKITINSGNINLETNNAVVGTNPFGNILITINTGGLLSTVNNTTILSEVLLDGGVIETAGGGDFTNGNYIFSDGLRTAGTGKTSFIQGGAVVLPTAVNVLAGDTLRIASVIMGNNNLVKQGVGTMVLTGSNTFTGATLVNGGLVEFNSTNAFGNAANKITLNGGGLRWATGNTADISGRLNAFGAAGATFDTNGNSVTLASVLSGSGALTKNGAGALRLTAANTYTGGTVINSGTLVAAQTNALGSGTVRVQGGMLDVQNAVTLSNDVVLSGGIYSRTVSGNLAGMVDATSDLAGGRDTTASILAGSLGSATTLVTSFSATSSAANDGFRESDVYHFDGTGSAIFVLELSADSLDDGAMLGWLDDGTWVNAVDGNIGNNATQAMQNFDGSYDEFVVQFSGVSLSQTIGAYGYDLETNAVWAVLNHNSDFAAIPEPSAGLLLLGGLVLLGARRSRGRMGFLRTR